MQQKSNHPPSIFCYFSLSEIKYLQNGDFLSFNGDTEESQPFKSITVTVVAYLFSLKVFWVACISKTNNFFQL